MKNVLAPIILSFLILTFLSSCNKVIKDSYRLLDSKLPKSEAKVFAANIISKDNRFEQTCSFSPDGKEFYYSYTDAEWKKSTILKVNVTNPIRQDTITITKSDYQSGQFIDASGNNIYVSSLLQTGAIWHADIYTAKKTINGWGESQQLLDPVNSIMCEWHPSLTLKGVMYFASERNSDHANADLYRAVSTGNGIYHVEKLSSNINTIYNETDPYIAPDESFLIFASNRPDGISEADMFLRDGGSGELDLYISYNKGNNKWSTPVNMGKGINTNAWEFAPTLSPDMKYLFFTRRTSFKTTVPSKIYWVSAQIIDQLRN